MINFLADLATLLDESMHPEHLARTLTYRNVEVATHEYDGQVRATLAGRSFFFSSCFPIDCYLGN